MICLVFFMVTSFFCVVDFLFNIRSVLGIVFLKQQNKVVFHDGTISQCEFGQYEEVMYCPEKGRLPPA